MASQYPELPEFGRRVRQRRVDLGLSQEELADRSDLHRTYVSSLERGERNVCLHNLIVLASALEFDPGELVKGFYVDDSNPRNLPSGSK
jgi:transcriptional regulator with XRE-family HTH domain